jgi:hypothetical protein
MYECCHSVYSVVPPQELHKITVPVGATLLCTVSTLFTAPAWLDWCTLHSADFTCTGLTWLVYTAQCWLYMHWPDLTGVQCTVLTLHALAWLEWCTRTQANLRVSPAYRQKSRILRWKNIWVSFISCFINLLNSLKFWFSSRNFSCNEKWYHKDIFN